MQYVIDAVVAARFLNGGDVGRFFDHADQALIAHGVGAEAARVNVSDVVADAAKAQVLLDLADGGGQILSIFGGRA